MKMSNPPNFNPFDAKFFRIAAITESGKDYYEFKVAGHYGKGYVKRYTYKQGLGVSVSSMRLHEDFVYTFKVDNNFFELVYIQAGYLEIYDANSKNHHRVTSGEYFFNVSKQAAGQVTHPKNETVSYIAINIHPAFIDSLGKTTTAMIVKINQFRKACGGGPVFIESSPDVKILLEKMLNCSQADDTIHNLTLQAAVIELLAYCLARLSLRSTPNAALKLSPTDLSQLNLAKQLLLDNMTAPPSIAKLSKELYLNPYKLKLGFKAVFGTTLYGYLRDKRIERAQLLLKTTDLMINTIALQVGYGNSSSFITSFKNKCGMTPKQYRQQINRALPSPPNSPFPGSGKLSPDAEALRELERENRELRETCTVIG